MTPILKGTASRLGLRKPTGVYCYRDGSILDEVRLMASTPVDQEAIRENIKRLADAVGCTLEEWQVEILAPYMELARKAAWDVPGPAHLRLEIDRPH